MDKNNLVAWLPFDTSTTADKCGNTWTATGNVSLSSEIKKFGAASVHLPNGAYLTANNIIDLNAEKWTFSAWAYLVSSSSDNGYFALSARTDDSRYGIINGNDGIYIAATSSGWQAKNTSITFPSVKNQWVHLAIVKNGTKVTFYQDGVTVWSFTTSALDNSGAFILGGNYYGYNTDIYFDEVIFYEGVALYSENFTPPTDSDYAALKADLGAKAIQYLSFTGSAGCYGELPLGVLAGATTFTIETKFSTTSTKSASNAWEWGTITGRELPMFGKDDFGFCVNDGKLCFWASPASKGSSNSNTQTVTSNATVSDGKIHKAAVVSNTDGSIDLYCDGELVAHTDNINAKITDAQTILLAYNSDSHSYLQMDLWEARFWSIARTQEQIFADIQGDEAGLEAWYIPNGSATLVDGSINGRDATLYGSPAYTYVDIMPIDISFDVERVVQNDAYIKPIAQSLKVWLPFDTSTTADKCGNAWTAYGSPTIENGALKLDGASYIQLNNAITLGGKDFTIHCRTNMPASTADYGMLLEATTSKGGVQRVELSRYRTANQMTLWANELWGICPVFDCPVDTTFHIAIVYQHTNALLKIYINGVQVASVSKSIGATSFAAFTVGANTRGSSKWIGTIDNFMIHSEALWTANFTPPTADDYFRLAMELDGYAPISLDFDVERQVNNAAKTWRYVNAGTADDLLTSGTTLTDLPESKSITGTAFYQTQRAKCFDIPATNEIWIKFDVYFDGSNRWRAYNDKNGEICGVCSYVDNNYDFGMWQNNTKIQDFSGVCKKNQLQTVLLHMVTGSSAGVIEAWVDGTLIYSYTGDVNHGEDFADIYLQSDGAGTFFSNVIISNTEIELGEGWQIFTFDVERQVAKAFDISFDVERQVKNVMPFQLDFDVEIKDILPFTIAADTERKIIVLVDLSADVELLSIVLVDFTADVTRNIKANINLYKTDVSEYFSGGSSTPIVIPTQEIVPPATDSEAVTQSIEITIAEQQITDQVKVVTAIPLDIMYPVQGQYLDFACDMRVERVSKQGILYTADCCSDLDALLYTQLAYTLKQKTNWYQKDSDGEEQEIETYYPPASEHVEKIANALGLTPVMQFDNFLSTLLFDDLGGLTYADIIRDVFGWSSRVRTHLINCYIRNGILYVIQRGHEANVIDISGADKTLPIYTHELVRTTWGSTPWSATQVAEKLGIDVPDDVVVSGGDSGSGGSGGDDSGGDSGNEHVAEAQTTIHGIDMEGYTTYSYNGKGLLSKVHSYSIQLSTGDTTDTTVNHNYDSDGTVTKTRTVTTNTNHNDNGSIETIETESVNEKSYITLSNGEKFLASEHSVKYENGILVDEQIVTHSPTRVGQSHSITQSSSGIVGEATGQNTGDDRVTPFSEAKAASLLNKLPDKEQIINGLPLFDSAFPIHNKDKLIELTEALKWLNRKTRETVTLSIYNFPHVIDFNDRIVLFGNEYYLVSNRAHTNPRIYNEQALTLVRWY